MNVNIDTNKLLEQIEKLEKEKNSMKELLDSSVKEQKELEDYWQSETSKKVDEEFKEFDEVRQEYTELVDGIIQYLKNVVVNNYVNYENKENELIDDNIATN